MPQIRRRTSGIFGPVSLSNFKPYPSHRRRVGFTHLASWSLEEVQTRYKAAEARVAVLHGRRFIKGMADADVRDLRAVPADQRPRALKLAQEEMNVLRDELRRRLSFRLP
jgi:hypothetical protein